METARVYDSLKEAGWQCPPLVAPSTDKSADSSSPLDQVLYHGPMTEPCSPLIGMVKQ